MASFQEAIQSLKEFDPNELNDFNQVGSWPIAVKVILWVLIFAGVLAAGYFVQVTKLQEELSTSQRKETELRGDYRDKYAQAVNLDLYLQQKEKMEAEFEAILEQLPADTEIPGLIEDINNVAVQNGLAFANIDLQPEKKHEFYIEKPIQISVTGTYHDLGAFVSDVADLSRIVTLHDFSISLAKGNSEEAAEGMLKMNILARTYRYNDERGG